MISAKAVSDLVYAGIQNEGGTITAGSKLLAVPLVPMAVGKWPRHWPDKKLFFMMSKRGSKLLMERVSKKKNRPVYVLKKSVRIPGMEYIDDAWSKSEGAVHDILGDKLFAEMSKA